MKARDVMVAPVITASVKATVKEVAGIFVERGISAVPVVDENGKLAGLISEGDLMRRAEIGTERRSSWWLRAFASDVTLASDYVRAHASNIADIMTTRVITAAPDTPLHEIATLMENHGIKRVPILSDGKLVGIVSRANLVQAIASVGKSPEVPLADTVIREKLLLHLQQQPWAHAGLLNVTVTDGVVDLWGMTDSDSQRTAIRVAAEGAPGVRGVNDHLVPYRTQRWQ